jgi:hypothetical protein
MIAQHWKIAWLQKTTYEIAKKYKIARNDLPTRLGFIKLRMPTTVYPNNELI